MRRILLAALCLLPLLLAACIGPGIATDADTPFTGVLMYQSIMGSGQYAVQVTAGGDVTVEVQPGPGNIQRAAGRLTPQQIAALAKAFKGWKDLQPNYPGDWTMLYRITYDNHKVESNDLFQAPANFVTVKGLLDSIGTQVMQAATRPAPPPPTSAPAPAGSPSSRP